MSTNSIDFLIYLCDSKLQGNYSVGVKALVEKIIQFGRIYLPLRFVSLIYN